jgi:hypothetical protein
MESGGNALANLDNSSVKEESKVSNKHSKQNSK